MDLIVFHTLPRFKLLSYPFILFYFAFLITFPLDLIIFQLIITEEKPMYKIVIYRGKIQNKLLGIEKNLSLHF